MRRIKFGDESGAIAVLFAILLSSSLVIGMFVLVADSGVLFSERRVIQKASDSSVMALTRECALLGTGAINSQGAYTSPVCDVETNATVFARAYTNINSPDLLTDVTQVCGRSVFQSCPTSPGGTYDCATVESRFLHYVRVRTATLTKSGTPITNQFNKILNSSDSGSTLPGCAQSAWGKASSAPILFPISLPICSYNSNALTTPVVISSFANNASTASCAPFTDLDGITWQYSNVTTGMAKLKEVKHCVLLVCTTTPFVCPSLASPLRVAVGDTVYIEPSLSQFTSICSNPDFYTVAAGFIGTTFFAPVVGSVNCNTGSTNGSCQGTYDFTVLSFVAFKLLGLKFANKASQELGAIPPGGWSTTQCGNNDECVYGLFSRAAVPGADVNTDPSFPAVGAQAIQLLP